MVVQGHAVQQRRLRDGDEVVLGKTRLLFEEPADQQLLALSSEPDRALPAEQPSAIETKTSAGSTPPEAPAAGRASSQPPAKRTSFDADVIIYSLAAVIIAISVAGILFLMRSQ